MHVFFRQLWDVRDGICKQTFTGHESDINAVTVSYQLNKPLSLIICQTEHLTLGYRD